MGSRPGGIAEHLLAVKDQVRKRLAWDTFHYLAKNRQSGLNKYTSESYWFPDGEPEQMPEVYTTYQQCKTWGKLWWDGGIADQPYFLMMEFDACAAGEADFRSEDLPEMQRVHQKGIDENSGTGASF